MAQSLAIPRVIPNDWKRLDLIINKIKMRLGSTGSPTFAGLTLTGLTASRLIWGDANKALASKDLIDLIAGTTNQIAVTDDITGGVILSITDPLAVPGKVTAGSFSSPTDVTATRQYGFELHYSGNDYDVTGIRSRAQLVTTDTSATAQGALLQAANNDGIDAGVLNGALIEAIGKSDTNASTISMMRGCLVNTEWGAYDTVTALHTLHVRLHSLNNAGAGSFGTGYGIYLENEAVGGNGQALDAGIYFKGTNLSAGNKAFGYGIDFSGATYGTADIKLSSSGNIDMNTGILGSSSGDLTIKPSSTYKVIVQPTTDSTTFFQVKNAAGTTFSLFDTTNKRFGVGEAAFTPGYTCSIGSADGADQVGIYHDNANAIFITNQGVFQFLSDQGTNHNSVVVVKGKGTGVGALYVNDQDNAEFVFFSCSTGRGRLETGGANVSHLDIQRAANAPITMFYQAIEGEIQELQITGYRTGDSQRSLEIGVGVDAADTASFDGVSNYLFDGTLILTGNLTMPDGGTIGQAAGPLLTFDDTNDFLEITGCKVGINTTTPGYLLNVKSTGGSTFPIMVQASDGQNIVGLYESSTGDGQFIIYDTDGNLAINMTAKPNVSGYVNNGGNFGIGTALPVTKLTVEGIVTLPKDSGNGIKVDTTTPTFGFADLLGDQFSKNTGGTKPTLITYNGAIDAWQFSDGDEAFLSYHIPHDYVPGTDIHLHIHWSQNNAGATGGTIDFKYFAIYSKGHNQASGSTFTSTPITDTFSSIDINDGNSGLDQYQQHITEVTISAASATAALFDRDDFEPDGVIELAFEMDANNLTGTPSDPFIHFVDIHYQTTGLIGTKQKAPDFYT